jgi:transposase-like protein
MQGLIKAVAAVFPESEHRFCVRHLYSNFQQNYKGENLKNQLWACARSTTPLQFHKNMEKMKVLNVKAFQWLEKCP